MNRVQKTETKGAKNTFLDNFDHFCPHSLQGPTYVCVCLCSGWFRGVGGGAEQWEGDVRLLSCPGPQLWFAQICPHKLGETLMHLLVELI